MNNESKVDSTSLNKLEYEDALNMMQDYGYSSASIHPYIYQNGDDLGICYSYNDADYGTLERIKLFESAEELKTYLEQMKWLETNGSLYHVRMALDNYETVYPRILFLRNERIMVPSEMEDIETYDYNLSKRAGLDDTTKILYEAGDLLLVYDELKARQLAYIQNLTVLRNTLRQKYFELQLEVDKYNRIGKIERQLSLVPDITDTGIDITLEIAIKDRYNQYVAQQPSFEEAVQLIRDTWEMCKALELNSKYYEVQIEDHNIRNEIKLVEAKLSLMKELNDDVKPLFGTDLVAKFRKINKEFLSKNNELSNDSINSQLALVDKKYGVFDQLEIFDVSEYLKEAIATSNIDELVKKYAKGNTIKDDKIVKLPLNEVASGLTVQFKEKLNQQEQAVLVLHNNPRFRQLFDAILNIPNFGTLPIKKVIKYVKKINGFSKLKSECFDILKKRLEDPVNATVKASLFASFDFSNFENYIASVVKLLGTLKGINGKLLLNSDVNMYTVVKEAEDVKSKTYTYLTNDINSMYIDAQTNKKMIALVVLKEGTSVFYAPYTFDLGDLYTKNASQQVFIKETIGFDLLVDNSILDMNIGDSKVTVVNYQSEKEISQNLTTAIALDAVYKTVFCRITFRNKDIPVSVPQESVTPVVETPIVVPVQENSVQQLPDHETLYKGPVTSGEPTSDFKSPNDIIKNAVVNQGEEPPVLPVNKAIEDETVVPEGDPVVFEKPVEEEQQTEEETKEEVEEVKLPEEDKNEPVVEEKAVETTPEEKTEENVNPFDVPASEPVKEETPVDVKVEEKKEEVPEQKEEPKKDEKKISVDDLYDSLMHPEIEQAKKEEESDKSEEEAKVENKKEEVPKVEESKEEQKAEEKAELPEKKDNVKVEEPKKEASSEDKKEESKVLDKPESLKPKEEVKKDELKEEPKVEEKKEVVKPVLPEKEEPKPIVEEKPIEKKEVPKVEEKKDVVKPILPEKKEEPKPVQTVKEDKPVDEKKEVKPITSEKKEEVKPKVEEKVEEKKEDVKPLIPEKKEETKVEEKKTEQSVKPVLPQSKEEKKEETKNEGNE